MMPLTASHETLDDMIFVANPDGEIVFTNRAVSQKLGYSPEALRTMRLIDLHPAEVRTEAEEILGAMFRKERDTCPLPLRSKSGKHLPVETRIWPGKWDQKDCLFGLSKDMTMRKQAADSLKELVDRMPVDKAEAVLQGLLSSVTSMARTLDDLLLAGKIEEGKLACNPAPFDLLSFLRRCSMEAGQAGEEPARIGISFQEAGRHVVADERLLEHILKNLLANALKYSPSDSRVEIIVDVRQDILTLSVLDRGIGVPEAERGFVFDAFFRSSNVGGKLGSGLGLFIAQKCAQAHGGRMKYTPQSTGSLFSMTIPLTALSQAEG